MSEIRRDVVIRPGDRITYKLPHALRPDAVPTTDVSFVIPHTAVEITVSTPIPDAPFAVGDNVRSSTGQREGVVDWIGYDEWYHGGMWMFRFVGDYGEYRAREFSVTVAAVNAEHVFPPCIKCGEDFFEVPGPDYTVDGVPVQCRNGHQAYVKPLGAQ